MSQEDQPLTEAFLENPLQYMQNHVRNLNNQIFLSQYHINSLYALLLVGRNSPWDMVKGNNPDVKDQIDHILNIKVRDVKSILENLSNMYEDKSKKSAINQIEKLMGILKSKKKSIFIEKDRESTSLKVLTQMAHNMEKSDKQKENKEEKEGSQKKEEDPENKTLNNEEKDNEEQTIVMINEYQQSAPRQQSQNGEKKVETKYERIQFSPSSSKIIKEERSFELNQQKIEEKQEKQPEPLQKPLEQKQKTACHYCSHHAERPQQKEQNGQNQNKKNKEKEFKEEKQRSGMSSGKQVFTIFYGLANLSNLTAMALTNIIEHNSVERFIKFKMSESYIMTIRCEDPFSFDSHSALSTLPPQMFTNHIFPYLTASELFQARGVCKQWMQNVKQSWHATFKRQMFVQLLACQFCKDIEFYYKTIQLRNPFFQKISLLIHALVEIISWDAVRTLINSNTLPLQLKRIFMILLRLIGQPIPFTTLNSITDQFYNQHKHKLDNIKQKVSTFFSSLSGSDLSINDLRVLKTNYLDDPFMRVDDINSDDKTPLLINLLVKQITLQQILRSHIYLAQEYLLNTKRRLDNISKKMVYHKGYLQGVYKILLLKSTEPLSAQSQTNQLPNFNQMLQSIFANDNSLSKPDFVIKSKCSSTQIYLDKATKLDIILSTVYNINQGNVEETQQKQIQNFKSQEEGLKGQEKMQKQLKNEIVNEVSLKVQTSQQTVPSAQEQLSQTKEEVPQQKQSQPSQKIEMKQKIQNGQQTEQKIQPSDVKIKIRSQNYSVNSLGQARKQEPK